MPGSTPTSSAAGRFASATPWSSTDGPGSPTSKKALSRLLERTDRKREVQRLLSLLIAAAVVVALAASSGTASTSTERFASNDGAASVSANWSGYALQDVNAAGLQ